MWSPPFRVARLPAKGLALKIRIPPDCDRHMGAFRRPLRYTRASKAGTSHESLADNLLSLGFRNHPNTAGRGTARRKSQGWFLGPRGCFWGSEGICGSDGAWYV